MREIAPTKKLLTVLKRDLDWKKFKEDYMEELSDKLKLIDQLRQLEKRDRFLTLLYSAKDPDHNNAAALREFMLQP